MADRLNKTVGHEVIHRATIARPHGGDIWLSKQFCANVLIVLNYTGFNYLNNLNFLDEYA